MNGRQEGDGRRYGVKESSFFFFFRMRAIWPCLQDEGKSVKRKIVFKCGEEAGTVHGWKGSRGHGLKPYGGVTVGCMVLVSSLSQEGRGGWGLGISMSLQVGEGVRNGWPMPVEKNRLSGGGGQGSGRA